MALRDWRESCRNRSRCERREKPVKPQGWPRKYNSYNFEHYTVSCLGESGVSAGEYDGQFINNTLLLPVFGETVAAVLLVWLPTRTTRNKFRRYTKCLSVSGCWSVSDSWTIEPTNQRNERTSRQAAVKTDAERWTFDYRPCPSADTYLRFRHCTGRVSPLMGHYLTKGNYQMIDRIGLAGGHKKCPNWRTMNLMV